MNVSFKRNFFKLDLKNEQKIRTFANVHFFDLFVVELASPTRQVWKLAELFFRRKKTSYKSTLTKFIIEVVDPVNNLENILTVEYFGLFIYKLRKMVQTENRETYIVKVYEFLREREVTWYYSMAMIDMEAEP